MSRQLNSPASSQTNSIRSSSRASRLRAISIKSGVTMMTTDSVEIETDLFRENYFKSQNQIEQYKKIRDQAESELRKMQVDLEFQKRQIRDIETNLNIRESLLKEREDPLSPEELRELPNLQREQRMAEQRREARINKADEIKSQINSTYQEISKILDDTIKNSTIRNDVPLLTIENKGLVEAIKKKTNRIMAMEEVATKHTLELNSLKERENNLNEDKNKMNEKYGSVENRRIEAIRVLADPIDSPDYEEKTVDDLEEDVKNTEGRYESIKKSDERDDTPKILAQIDKLEQQNIKRRAVIENKKAILTNQRKFRERRVNEDQKRIQQQKDSIEQLKKEIAEAEKIRRERESKEADEDENEDNSMPYKKYVPTAKIRDPKELIEQLKIFEKKNQENLDKIVNDISQMEQKYKNARAVDQEKWKRLMRRIDTYTKRITKKEAMVLSISELNEKNEELTEKLKTLVQAKDQLKRRKHMNITRQEDSNKTEDQGSSFEVISNELKQKLLDIEMKTEQIHDRNVEVEKKKVEVEKIEDVVGEKTKRVLEIEARVAAYKDKMSNAVNNLNSDQQNLDNTIATLETKL